MLREYLTKQPALATMALADCIKPQHRSYSGIVCKQYTTSDNYLGYHLTALYGSIRQHDMQRHQEYV